MPPKRLFDFDGLDLEREEVSLDAVQRINPQRHEFLQIQRVCYMSMEEKIIVGVRDLQEDEFWVRGHMPGRPIFPGVLMLEAAAQLGSVLTTSIMGGVAVMGFGGATDVRFRKMVTVGDRMVYVVQCDNMTARRSRHRAQAFVDGSLAFEATVLGIALPGRGRDSSSKEEPA